MLHIFMKHLRHKLHHIATKKTSTPKKIDKKLATYKSKTKKIVMP